jgi:hypothetical protein
MIALSVCCLSRMTASALPLRLFPIASFQLQPFATRAIPFISFQRETSATRAHLLRLVPFIISLHVTVLVCRWTCSWLAASARDIHKARIPKKYPAAQPPSTLQPFAISRWPDSGCAKWTAAATREFRMKAVHISKFDSELIQYSLTIGSEKTCTEARVAGCQVYENGAAELSNEVS